jgi:hypothetical protein
VTLETNTRCATVRDCSALWSCTTDVTALRGDSIALWLQILQECNAVMLFVFAGGMDAVECFAIAAQCACLFSGGWSAFCARASDAGTQQL